MNRLLLDTLPRLVAEALTRSLMPGETLHWAAPQVPSAAAWGKLPVVLFGLPWTAFAVFWMWAAGTGFGEGSDPFSGFALFGLPFVLIGIAMLSSPIYAYWLAQRSGYAITDQRAIVITIGASTTIRDFPHRGADPLSVRYYGRGLADIILGQDIQEGSRRTNVRMVGLLGLAEADARQAERLLRALRQPHLA